MYCDTARNGLNNNLTMLNQSNQGLSDALIETIHYNGTDAVACLKGDFYCFVD